MNNNNEIITDNGPIRQIEYIFIDIFIRFTI